MKAQLAAGVKLPRVGQGVHQRARRATSRARSSSRSMLRRARLRARRDARHRGGARGGRRAGDAGQQGAEGRPHIVDMIKNDEIALIVNTVEEKRSAIQDSYAIRRAALTDQVPTYTTLAGARAAAIGHGEHARARPVLDPGAARVALTRPSPRVELRDGTRRVIRAFSASTHPRRMHSCEKSVCRAPSCEHHCVERVHRPIQLNACAPIIQSVT